ncbi:MAG: hypothetical protein R3F19_07180 [Verrucomicrobiales bacterium]
MEISAGSITSGAQFAVSGDAELLASGTGQVNANELFFLETSTHPIGQFSGNSIVTLTGSSGLVLGYDYNVSFADSAQLNGTQLSFGFSYGTITVSDSAVLTFSGGMVSPLSNDTLRLEGGGQVSIAGNADFQPGFTIDFVSGATGSFSAGTLSGAATDYAGLIAAGIFTVDGAAATSNQFKIDGTSIALAIPEPSVISLACLFITIYAFRRKR